MMTNYHAKYYAYELTARHSSASVDRISRSLFDASVDLNPHQIEASLFALRSPLSKGVVLADEVGLGKTIEAALVLCQLWAERKRNLLIICPASLRKQWATELQEKFNLPTQILDTTTFKKYQKQGVYNPLLSGKITIVSYHFPLRLEESFIAVPWDLVVIDEAHKLRNAHRQSNKIGQTLKRIFEGRNKLLLTATPLQNSLIELDGQQRMTSVYLALAGTYAYKKPYMARNNPNAYPERKLYLNLLKPSEELEVEYDFRFLTKDEAATPNEGYHWFPCSEILNFEDISKVSLFLMKNKLMNTSVYNEQQSEFAINTLNAFFNIIHQKGTISYYLEEGEELDKVLQIFIRINSGGTKLSYSDLLLSIATAQWNEKDAREVVHEFVDDINNIGDGFAFNKDLVLKNCLVLADFTDVKFKVDNFNKTNMSIIERDWEKTSSALRAAIELVAKFGYSAENLIATNAIIPIAYFIFKNACGDQILHAGKWESDRKAIKEWLARVLLKGTFGGQPDSIYPGMRDLINANLGRFPLKETIAFYKGKRKSISFSSDEIDNLLEFQYGKAKTYCVLTLIYPALNHSFKYHQDHIHPKSKFNKRSMRAAGLSEEQIEQLNAEANGIANLQLLEATGNIEKNDKPFKDWLNLSYPEKAGRDRYLEQHHINPDQSLEFEDFMDFVSARRKTLKGLFTSILGATAEQNESEQRMAS